MGQKGKRGDIF